MVCALHSPAAFAGPSRSISVPARFILKPSARTARKRARSSRSGGDESRRLLLSSTVADQCGTHPFISHQNHHSEARPRFFKRVYGRSEEKESLNDADL